MGKEKVLVTGGLGFIGSHIVDLLCEKGYEVAVIDTKLWSEYDYVRPEVRYFKCDICDLGELKNRFGLVEPDYVIHCAALARIQPSFENPFEYFLVNVEGTRNILEFSRRFGVKRVVFSASSSAYGEQNMPLHENMRLNAQAKHPYGATKREGEMMMSYLGKMTGGPETVCLRYFNVYGPRQTTLADGPYATVVGIFLSQKEAKKPLTVVSPGSQRRDFTHVYDVAKANYLAMVSGRVGDAEIINVGTGRDYSIWDVACLVLGKPLPPKTAPSQLLNSGECILLPERPGEVSVTRAAVLKAKGLLNWEPEILLEQGIKMC